MLMVSEVGLAEVDSGNLTFGFFLYFVFGFFFLCLDFFLYFVFGFFFIFCVWNFEDVFPEILMADFYLLPFSFLVDNFRL